jgi:hypothetical protein
MMRRLYSERKDYFMILFADKRFEISNQELVKDLMDILNMFEI